MPAAPRRRETPRPRRRRPGRNAVALLLVLGTVATLGASVALWLDRQAVSDRGWADTSPRLIADPSIRRAVGTFAVDQLLARTHVAQALGQVLPAGLATATLGQVRSLGLRLAGQILASTAARRVWNTANRQAHGQLLAILDHGATHGEVRLDLSALLEELVSALRASPLVKSVPDAGQVLVVGSSHAGEIPLLSADQVRTARAAVNTIRGLSVVLLLVALVLFGIAVVVAGAIVPVGCSLVLVAAVILIARGLGAPALADALVSSPAYRPAARSAWLIGTSELRDTAVATLILGAVLLTGAMALRAVMARRRRSAQRPRRR